MHIAIVTMVYNERINLPIWIRHYTAQCPGAVLFVIDHGSDDGSTRGVHGVNLIPLPRTPFDDQHRADMVADLQHALLQFYDVVIYTDCDEMLVADPRIHTSLASFLAATDAGVIAPIGLNLHHLIGSEPPINLQAPVLGQRRTVRFASSMCKPSITRVPVRWVPGFHWCDHIPDYRRDLFQIHLKWMDIDASLGRLHLTRTMAWSDRALRNNWAPRQRQTDEERIRQEFEEPARVVASNGAAPFEFEPEMQRVLDSMRLHNQYYQVDAFRGRIAALPDPFSNLV